ncbi:MAG: tRNA (N(6)-L-threonylcarbamoyladenosine(37)-C(2))-methylthiotransferase MtaB, partial [Clostridia bacterium]
FERGYVGKTVSVLFEQTKDGVSEGLSKNYLRVYVPSEKDLTDKILDVKLTEYKDGKLCGTLK